ncbi:hypothetical protein IEQ34_002298 [Dendrobium chrysotoxum]|uniref:Uncharacterized protein n=1 Tax=Dendrobium chrysotoxum TaxID=161865 RepID=A0AAV7HJ37_DENCH|nr:hypothetical protein IEQ34_002298 [Dendrobium chrysotoxum]
MFHRIIVTSENVWIPTYGVLPLELIDNQTISFEEEYTQDEQIHLPHVTDLVCTTRSISYAISTSNAQHKSFTILEALEEISKIPDIFDDFELYDFATDFLKDKDDRDTFMGVPIERKTRTRNECTNENNALDWPNMMSKHPKLCYGNVLSSFDILLPENKLIMSEDSLRFGEDEVLDDMSQVHEHKVITGNMNMEPYFDITLIRKFSLKLHNYQGDDDILVYD